MKGKGWRIGLIIIVLLCILYLLGPRPPQPVYSEKLPEIPPLPQLEIFIQQKEASLQIRPENESQIIWAHDTAATTEVVFLYLHGFTASPMEGHPTHRNVAKHFNANLYLPRLYAHGLISENPLANFSAEKLWESALEALQIASSLGDKVIIISTSTGSPLALQLAATFPDQVFALVNLSPNFKINSKAAFLLDDPWGEEIATAVFGAQRSIQHREAEAGRYWDTIHDVQALVQLELLLETTLTEQNFKNVSCPVLSLYYYKNEEEQDQVVDVAVIPGIHRQLRSPATFNRYKALAEPGNHVIGSSLKSRNYKVVQEEVINFCREILAQPDFPRQNG